MRKKIVTQPGRKLLLAFLFIFTAFLPSQAQIINTIAGSGVSGFGGDGGPATATAAKIAQSYGVVRYYAGNLYIGDDGNNRIRKINPFTGVISTIAGPGTPGVLGDGGPAISAYLHSPEYIEVDHSGNLYISDQLNYRIRKVSPSGIITTIAGTGVSGYSGDGSAATAAKISFPAGLVYESSSGDLYFCDNLNNCIRKVDAYGNMWTIAGTGVAGYTGDGGAAATATMHFPTGICMDAAGNIYFSDWANHAVRKISGGIISTVAGTGAFGYTGDTGPATAAQLHGPEGLGIDNANNFLYIADGNNNVVRRVDLTTGIITTVVGTGLPGYTGDGIAATTAKLNYPTGLDIDCAGNLYVSDANNYRIRYVNYNTNNNPVFANGSTTSFSMCANSTASINSLLAVSDADAGQDEWWVVNAAPSHGALGGFVTSAIAPAFPGTVAPTGLTYTPTVGYSGTDNFTIGVADCAGGTAVISITVTVNPAPAAITGSSLVCSGSAITLGDATPGGAWSSSNTGIATVGSSSGIVTGVSTGVDTITYTLASGCGSVTKTITVNPSPAPITGTSVICAGTNTTLTDATPGGVWSSAHTGIATIGSTGIVHGVAAGVDTILYTVTSTCGTVSVAFSLTVNPLPASIGGTLAMCVGATTTLTDATGGGAWTSGNTAIATIGSGTGTVTGVSAGTSLITYALPTGCAATATVTVNPLPAAITGTLTVCAGATTTLTDGTGGGAWASGSPLVATVGSGTGIVTGIAAGTATITYGIVATGCRVTATVTVNPVPAAITGTLTICAGATATLTDATGGGAWASSAPGTATVGSSSGIVTGIAVGTATITYMLPTGCAATATVTVNTQPAIITGSSVICTGSSTTLTDGTGGGAWSSSNTAVATIGSSSGLLSGVATGTAIITYMLPTGCRAATTITVNSLPSAITGNTPVCTGQTLTLGDPDAGGTWSSSNPAIATVGSASGIVTGVASGTATVTYSLGTGCATTATVTVNTSPAAITGGASVCAGLTTTLTDATTGGAWSSSNTAIATVGSASGIVTGVTAGTANITYTIPDGCFTTVTVTVQSPAPITGTTSVCTGQTTTLSDATTGGTWSSAAPGIAAVGSASGIVTGVTAGTTTITYTWGGCTTTTLFTVNTSPAAITGGTSVCVGATTTLTDATTGGIWSSSDPATATVGSASGIVTGIAAGTVMITYTLPAGCYTTTTVTVNPLPATITGSSIVCTGYTITLSDATTGGAWSSGNPAIATIGSGSGVVTGISAGTVAITYTLPTGCITTYSIAVDTVPLPITGITAICMGHTTTLSDASGGGTWSSSNTAVATVGTSGVVTTVSSGTAIITYTTVAGCYVTTTVAPLTISGIHNMCPWSDSLLAVSAPGGSYSSTGVTVTNLGGGLGEVHSHAPGVDTVFYTLSTGCITNVVLTVNPLPGAITGIFHVCSGSTTTLADATPGGTWSATPTTIATVGSSTGIVTGVSTGTASVTYTLPTGCFLDTPVVVNPAPTPISGSGFLCDSSTITLTDGIAGGTWTSSDTTIAKVGATTGIVTGIASGIATITYTLCTATATLTVTVSIVPPIQGGTTVCMGATDTLTDAAPGGTWSSNHAWIATVSSSGVVTPVSPGTTTISYQLSSGCIATYLITVTGSTGACTPCGVFGAYTPLGTSGHITGNVPPGNYYIANNVLVTGTDTFTNAIVLVAPGDTVFIDTSSLLVLDSSHLFSLCSEWAGMSLKPGRTHSGRLYVTSHSLIEDAACAVYIPNAVTPPPGSYIFKSEASIYNRNQCGVFIQHYTPPTDNYPFLIHNSVFTSRDLQTPAAAHFPYKWPAASGTLGLKHYWNPSDTFAAPYLINKPVDAGLGYAYAGAYCYNGFVPRYGIRLDSVGTNDVVGAHVGVPIPGHYYEITVGDTGVTDANDNLNLFDNLMFGVYSVNSNLTSINNAFTNLFSDNEVILGYTGPLGGDGIYAATTDDVANENRLRVYTPAGARYNNKFYNFNYGVEASNMFQVIGQHTYMINKNFPKRFAPPIGSGGYSVKTAKYDLIDIFNDTITNVINGVAVWMAYDPTLWVSYTGGGGFGYIYAIPSQYMGTCNINYNRIQAHPDWTATLSNQMVKTAIAYQNPYTYIPSRLFGPVVSTTNNLTIAANTIHDAYNGIYVNNYAAPRGYHTYTTSNKIWERQNTTGTLPRLQYGINHTACYNSYIYYDSVVTGTVAATSGRGTDSMRAFYSAANAGMDMGCNQEANLGRGFEFFLPHGATNWHDNRMTSNYKGFVLNGATIGAQVNGGTTLASRSINDKWMGTWGGTDTQTYVIRTNAYSSQLYMTIGGTTYPNVNGGVPPLLRYAPFNGLDTAAILAPDCFLHWGTPSDTTSLYDLIAQQQVNYVYNVLPSTWMGQFALWKAALLDSTIADSSAVVAEFVHLADSGSRFKYITDIETALSAGDLATANGLLGMSIDPMANTSYDPVSQVWLADDTSADYIVQAYQQYYSLYINYVTAAMSSADSVNILALAQLCPERYGSVVFQARALYSDIYNDLSVFNDDSCMDVDTTYIAYRHSHNNPPAITTSGDMQGYSLYPNPNGGSFTLMQRIQDEQQVTATIYDAIGREMYNGAVQFANAKGHMDLSNYAPGMYILELKDTGNRIFRFKFVISK